jgi:hypothetical protein
MSYNKATIKTILWIFLISSTGGLAVAFVFAVVTESSSRTHHLDDVTEVLVVKEKCPTPKPVPSRPAATKKEPHRFPLGETVCSETGNVFFSKRCDKGHPCYLEVAIQYNMINAHTWPQMFVFACELRYGDNLHNSRANYVRSILDAGSNQSGGLLINLSGVRKDKIKHRYAFKCVCTHTPMEGLKFVHSDLVPGE